MTCIQSERQALLSFKQDLKDLSDRLAAWTNNGDCCKWEGIFCSNVNGHVMELHLGSSKLGGKLNPSLLELKCLSYLDISDNDFPETQIPTWFWKFSSNLYYLNISYNHFQGQIPDLLTMIHPSAVIDLSSNNFNGPLPLISSNVISIDLSINSLSGSFSRFFCHKINKPMKLEILNLGHNLLSGEIPYCWGNWPSLAGEIPEEVTSLVGLQSLNFSHNLLVGNIPDNIGAMGSLECVDLSTNELSREIPPSVSHLSFLSLLNLSYNKIAGKIPTSTQLQSLSASNFLGTELFGPPLSESPKSGRFSSSVGNEVHDQHEVDWLFISIVLGICLVSLLCSASQGDLNIINMRMR
ncbi:hypothetical protein DITRI_Ditri09bG0092400 [Diplodiscus trichospermus]